MKTKTMLRLLVVGGLMGLLAGALTGCGSLTPEQEARAARLVDLALRYAEASGKINAEDAALVREAKVIVLEGETEELPAVEVTAGK